MIEETITPPPQIKEEEAVAKWVLYTRRYGDPVYMEPFWFWDQGRPFGPTGPDRNTVGILGSKSPDAIQAASVWNKLAIEDLPWWGSASPPFLEDHTGMKPNEPEAPEVHEGHEASKKRALDLSKEISRWAALYTVVGIVGTAILARKYKKNK